MKLAVHLHDKWSDQEQEDDAAGFHFNLKKLLKIDSFLMPIFLGCIGMTQWMILSELGAELDCDYGCQLYYHVEVQNKICDHSIYHVSWDVKIFSYHG